MQSPNFITVDYAEPHKLRNKQIVLAHPEVKDLYGNDSKTFFYSFIAVALQVTLAVSLRHSSWWMILAVAYIVGAVANHALFVLIHECAHNLIFKSARANKLLAIFTNLPVGFPMALSFRKYHLLHHNHQGDQEYDADVPWRSEAKLVGKSFFLKALWLMSFALVEAVRPAALKKINLFDRWTILNIVVQIAFVAPLIYFFGAKAFIYLILSSLFSVGLHPLGARWIQEHYVVKDNQETYSYYGPLNKLALNVGYHNEHHDFMYVSWRNLPKVKRLAPEFYDSLHSHNSWTSLLLLFLKNPEINLFSRVVRSSAEK